MQENDVLQQRIDRALAYPNTRQADYRASYLFARAGGNEFCPDIVPHTVDATIDGSTRLTGTKRDVPTWRLSFQDGDGKAYTLNNRVAVMGYSSNASKDVLHQKFSDYASAADTGLEICVLSARLRHHAVVHGAFIGDNGPIPATLWADDMAESTVSVGFYDAAAVTHMTGTEPNYDGILMDAPLELARGTRVKHALSYVAIWGALSDKLVGGRGEQPIALPVVPSVGTMLRRTSYAAMAALIKAQTGAATCPDENSIVAFVRESITSESHRLSRTHFLQQNFKLEMAPHNRVSGQRIFSAKNLHQLAQLKHA